MKKKIIFLRLLLLFLSCVLLTGCFNSKYIGRKQYLFDLPGVQEKAKISPCMLNVFFESAQAVAPFDQTDFLYRVSKNRYLIDYYNGFLVSPSEQIDTILKFNYGGFSSDFVKAWNREKRLQVKLVELYADYRDADNPKAVIALHFVLTKLINVDVIRKTNGEYKIDAKTKSKKLIPIKEVKTVVLLDKVFKSSIPLQEKSTQGLINAWNCGLKSTLKRGFRSLQNKLGC